MATKQKKRIEIGQTVYARWHGESEFAVIGKVDGQTFPHYLCKLSSLYAIEETWVFPITHLSTESISKLTGSSNRKQLSLFTNGNVSDSQGSTAKGEGRES